MKLYYEDEPHILDNISKEEEDYLFSTRGQKIAKLNSIKNKYMNKNNFHMGGKYRDYVERMRKDETLVLDMHGKNISHLVLSVVIISINVYGIYNIKRMQKNKIIHPKAYL